MKPIPESVTVNTGDQYLIQPIIDDFFKDIAEHLKANYALPSETEPFESFLIESGEIAYPGLASGDNKGDHKVTDDRVTYLSFFSKSCCNGDGKKN